MHVTRDTAVHQASKHALHFTAKLAHRVVSTPGLLLLRVLLMIRGRHSELAKLFIAQPMEALLVRVATDSINPSLHTNTVQFMPPRSLAITKKGSTATLTVSLLYYMGKIDKKKRKETTYKQDKEHVHRHAYTSTSGHVHSSPKTAHRTTAEPRHAIPSLSFLPPPASRKAAASRGPSWPGGYPTS